MGEQIFLTVHAWLTSGGWAAPLGAFLWGLVSVALSPCHLASIPLIITYVAGQERAVAPRQAVGYAAVFTGGLFLTIAAVGVISSLLGRLLGDVGPYWSLAVGAVLLWVSLDMLGLAHLPLSGRHLARLRVRGLHGALILGLAYGVLSGSCTFGFLAPILAVTSLQTSLYASGLMIVLFGLGHALPIAVAGSSTALAGKVLAGDSFQEGSRWFRRAAGVGIGLLGLYFLVTPLYSALG
ncbi:MAG: cytochrome C biosynthesis protein [Deltaproteobacteria bacterium]|nr:cytochrome C biosynthesis protein [Deltaproteobacteria bacterium]